MLPRFALDRVLCCEVWRVDFCVCYIIRVCVLFRLFVIRFGVRVCGLFAVVAATFGRDWPMCGMWRATTTTTTGGLRLATRANADLHISCICRYIICVAFTMDAHATMYIQASQ